MDTIRASGTQVLAIPILMMSKIPSKTHKFPKSEKKSTHHCVNSRHLTRVWWPGGIFVDVSSQIVWPVFLLLYLRRGEISRKIVIRPTLVQKSSRFDLLFLAWEISSPSSSSHSSGKTMVNEPLIKPFSLASNIIDRLKTNVDTEDTNQ